MSHYPPLVATHARKKCGDIERGQNGVNWYSVVRELQQVYENV